MFRFATIEELRSSASRFLALLLVLHLPAVLAIGLVNHTSIAVPFALAAIAVAAGAVLAFRAPLALATRLVITVATVLMPMIFVHLAMGPLQIDWHMYFFPVLVMIALWIDWRPLVLGVALIAVHHLVMSFVMPMSVFPDQAGLAALPRVLLHASIVIAQAGVLLWLMEAIRRLYARVQHESSVAKDALAEAEGLRAVLEGEAREREAAARDLELALTSSVAASEQAALAEERRHEMEQSVARSQIDFVRRTAERMDESVGALVEKFAAATDNLLASARSAQEAAAAADSDSRLISAEAHESSVMVNSVATAALQLSTTSADILSRMQTALVVGEKASNHTSSGSQFARSLENGSGRIDDVTAIIENIASQTNLLALNAAIEAARAGDAGRGFAVVADEVRKLADETTTATREIAQVVASMRDNTKNVIDVMKLIESSVAEMLSMATDVAAAVEEQTAATRQIADATTQVRSATLQTASASERLTAVAELSGEASRQVFSESQSVAATTTTLRQSVEKMVGDIMRHANAQTPV